MKTRISFITSLLFVTLVMCGCGWNIAGEVHVEEVSRTLAPNRKVEAVVEMRDGGATTSRAYCVYIVPRGDEPTEDYHLLTFDGPTDLFGGYGLSKSEWSSPFIFEATYAKVKRIYKIRDEIQIGDGIYRVVPKT